LAGRLGSPIRTSAGIFRPWCRARIIVRLKPRFGDGPGERSRKMLN
jgi:hypothetical protein